MAKKKSLIDSLASLPARNRLSDTAEQTIAEVVAWMKAQTDAGKPLPKHADVLKLLRDNRGIAITLKQLQNRLYRNG